MSIDHDFMYRILYRLIVSMARLAVRSGPSKDLEIVVLRHQLAVLPAATASASRPAVRTGDRQRRTSVGTCQMGHPAVRLV